MPCYVAVRRPGPLGTGAQSLTRGNRKLHGSENAESIAKIILLRSYLPFCICHETIFFESHHPADASASWFTPNESLQSVPYTSLNAKTPKTQTSAPCVRI